jgi:hypothetical protein
MGESLMLDRLRSLVVAVSLAILIWLYARSRQIDGLGRPIPAGPSYPALRSLEEDRRHAEAQTMEMDVPIRFLCPADWPWRVRLRHSPDSCCLKLALRSPSASVTPVAYVDLTNGPLLLGCHRMPVQFFLPSGCVLEDAHPLMVDIELLARRSKDEEGKWTSEEP